MDERRTPTVAETEATRWHIRLRSPDVTPRDQLLFQAWVERDREHRRAFDAVQATWERLGVLSTDGLPKRSDIVARRLLTAPRWAAAGIALAIVVVAATSVYVGNDRTTVIAADVGSHLFNTLPDGSTVELGSSARLTYRFTSRNRSVRLDRGEALFDVRHDAGRPFKVSTPFGAILVHGTSFLVRVDEMGARATVLRGVVEGSSEHPGALVSNSPPAQNSGRSSVIGHANEEISFTNAGLVVAPVDAPLMARRLAWRDGMLAFDGETLLEVTKEVGLRSGVTFEFADPALQTLRIGGYIKADDLEAFQALLQANFGIHATRLNENRVRLEREAQ